MNQALISAAMLALLLGAAPAVAGEIAAAAADGDEGGPPAADDEGAPPAAEADPDEEEDDDGPEARARRLDAERRAVEHALGQTLAPDFEAYLASPYNLHGRSFALYMYDSARDLRNAGIGLAVAAPVLAGGGFGAFFGLQGSSFEGRVSGAAVLWAASAACLGAGAALWLLWGDDVDRLAPLVGADRKARSALRPFVAPLADREGRRGLMVGFRY